MVTAPECNVLIDAEGDLYACDAMPENMHYGDVKTGINQDAWNNVAAPCGVREECVSCVFLPHCTEFDRCPNRTEYDACYRQEKRKLERELRIVYQIYQEQKAQKQKEKD
jgi:radical SAM protein with 4Fe4S-binding SPASM domain